MSFRIATVTTAALLGLGLNAATIERALVTEQGALQSASPASISRQLGQARFIDSPRRAYYRPAVYHATTRPAEPRDHVLRLIGSGIESGCGLGTGSQGCSASSKAVVEIAVSASVLRRISDIAMPHRQPAPR